MHSQVLNLLSCISRCSWVNFTSVKEWCVSLEWPQWLVTGGSSIYQPASNNYLLYVDLVAWGTTDSLLSTTKEGTSGQWCYHALWKLPPVVGSHYQHILVQKLQTRHLPSLDRNLLVRRQVCVWDHHLLHFWFSGHFLLNDEITVVNDI